MGTVLGLLTSDTLGLPVAKLLPVPPLAVPLELRLGEKEIVVEVVWDSVVCGGLREGRGCGR